MGHGRSEDGEGDGERARPQGAVSEEFQGRPLGLRLIIFQKFLGALCLFAIAGLLFYLYWNNITNVARLILPNDVLDDPHRLVARLLLKYATGISRKTPLIGSVSFAAWGILLLTQGIGLLLERHWAEWLVIGEVMGFLPFEVAGLWHTFSWYKVGAIALNLLIVWYLARRYLRRRRQRRARLAARALAIDVHERAPVTLGR